MILSSRLAWIHGEGQISEPVGLYSKDGSEEAALLHSHQDDNSLASFPFAPEGLRKEKGEGKSEECRLGKHEIFSRGSLEFS